jgi:predicted Na+-dependent transporter
MMLCPVVAGQIVRVCAKRFISSHRSARSIVANCCILAIVFLALYRAASDPDFTSSVARMAWPFVFLAASNVALVAIAWAGAKLLRLPRASVVTVVFTAPQKTLALGVPLLSTYFSSDPEVLAVAILPLLFYHPWQLFVAGIVRGLLARVHERS